MAIETTYFPVLADVTTSDYAEKHIKNYIYPYFQKNATEYFETITFDDEDNTLKCYVGELLAMQVNSEGGKGSLNIVLTLPNGSSKRYYSSDSLMNSYFTFIRSATKTSKGIGFSICINKTDKQTSFYITKSNKGNTVIVGLLGSSVYDYSLSPSTSNYVTIVNFGGQADFQKLTSVASSMVNLSNQTILVPFALNNTDDYVDNVSLAFFYQTTSEVKLELNGAKYAYSYYFALKE